ncbi:hypothetical protein K353_02497 [Kitasatospora sp. SolWspMP-SS2h]|uniref:hypothetical protein n=1 Tax=Kitasatospora sp. SolWspMP-SS2h TaxID=1305729 RepID=UPI000DBA8AB1|nr:hypothetical protein [Kitasatospora sp. SolWspMP-SS2h]RAJ42820.1 hypothetical protein K353_02497 [Kitasatospora sp. SolWspMP-SS2h]
MTTASKRLGLALLLLAVAFPAAARILFGALAAVAAAALAHPSAAFGLAGGLLLATALPGLRRRASRRLRTVRRLVRLAAS